MIKIYVWKKTDASILGHAAMEVWAEDVQRKFYVSWYPGKDVSFFIYFGNGGEYCVPGLAYPSFEVEITISKRGHRPDLTVAIPAKSAASSDDFPEINEGKIKKAWENILKQAQWCLSGKNCSTVIYELMQAGGAPSDAQMREHAKNWEKRNDDPIPGTQKDWFGKMELEKFGAGMWTPIRLYNYALAVRSAQIGFR